MNKKVQALILGIMCVILTMAICVQIKTVKNNGTTLGRTEKETQLMDQVLKMKEKYDNAYDDLISLEEELEEVRKNVASKNEKLEKLEKEIKQANTLLGYTDATGSGVTIIVEDGISTPNTLNPSDLLVHDLDILNLVNELKNAGAEAIEVNGKRVVSTTSIMCDGNVITINGEKIGAPFVINAIGLPEQMATLNRPGGYIMEYLDRYVRTDFKKVETITIPKYTGIINFEYAKSK